MSDAIIVAIISVVGSLITCIVSSIITNKLIGYRVGQLEKKVDQHNKVIDRTYRLEQNVAVLNTEKDNIKQEIKELQEDER